jgi:hypothetical protein
MFIVDALGQMRVAGGLYVTRSDIVAALRAIPPARASAICDAIAIVDILFTVHIAGHLLPEDYC